MRLAIENVTAAVDEHRPPPPPPVLAQQMAAHPEVAELVSKVQQDPGSLQPMLEALSRTNPPLIQVIKDNVQAFQDVLNARAVLPALSPSAKRSS